ncbi:hypothetical protein V1477_005548 [Vespula maculifrons]|uniref:Uncharacterized protein n=1 Tax=Vespula maculifrons TaxID=7453 RepID=A0ABD2CPY3_VESMC
MKKEYFIVEEARKVTKHCYGPDLARAHFAAEFVISANKISLRLVGVDRVGLLDCVYKREEGKRRWRRRRLEEEEEKEEEEEEEEREVPQEERAVSIDGPREVRGLRGKWGVGLS